MIFSSDYLLAEAERKKREKQEALDKERAEDAKAEAKFLRQQEQLRLEAESEKLRKIEEDRVRYLIENDTCKLYYLYIFRRR